MSSDRDTTESHQARLIAWMADAPGDDWTTPKFRLGLTTTSSPASPYTRNTTPSSKHPLERAAGPYFTSLMNPASSASTSSNTQRSEESLFCEHSCGCQEECKTESDSQSYKCMTQSEREAPQGTLRIPDPPVGWIGEALLDLEETLSSKNEDYKIDGEFSNFEFAGQVADLHPFDVMLTQIGIKLGRLKGLAKDPNNEPKLDTFKDLAGYAVILYAYILSQEGDR